MGAAITVSRTEFTPTQLRAIAERKAGMDQQTLRDWVQ